jgi:RimJ/RimL family protein N-acetyltransferase
MNTDRLSVRELQAPDIAPLTDYWLNGSDAFLTGMGVDLSKMPSREQWAGMLGEQLQQPYEEKRSYCIIWLYDGKPVGHSNVNKIIFGQEAYMHLHIWDDGIRKKGLGNAFIKLTLPYFFTNLQLKKLYCEPYALNEAPNRTLEKAGFSFVREYITTPGGLNFEQPVKLWEMSGKKFRSLGGLESLDKQPENNSDLIF